MNEREAFEEWRGDIPLEYDDSDLWEAFKAGRAPLLKRIEELEFDVKVLSDGIEGGTEK